MSVAGRPLTGVATAGLRGRQPSRCRPLRGTASRTSRSTTCITSKHDPSARRTFAAIETNCGVSCTSVDSSLLQLSPTHTRIDRYIELVDGELESSQSVGVSGALPHPKTTDPLSAIVITPITRNRCFAGLFTRDTIFLGDGDHWSGGDGVVERPGPDSQPVRGADRYLHRPGERRLDLGKDTVDAVAVR